MYEAFYEMKQTPFVRNIPSEELYESPAMAEAFARLNYAADRQLFAVLTSDAGCGKSTLIRRFNDNLPKDKYLLLYVSDSKLTPKWLYKSLLDQLGLEAGFYRGDAKRLLQKQIEIIRTKEHRKVVCVLDEAHLLEKETLEEFRFLLSVRMNYGIRSCDISDMPQYGRESILPAFFRIWICLRHRCISIPICIMQESIIRCLQKKL